MLGTRFTALPTLITDIVMPMNLGTVSKRGTTPSALRRQRPVSAPYERPRHQNTAKELYRLSAQQESIITDGGGNDRGTPRYRKQIPLKLGAIDGTKKKTIASGRRPSHIIRRIRSDKV